MEQTMSRVKMRGKKLDDDCKKANISKHESGPHDSRCFCYGLIDCTTDDTLKKCVGCGAYALNAKPLRIRGGGDDN